MPEELLFARDVQAGDVLLMSDYCERLTVFRVHDETVEDSRVSVRRFETTARDGKLAPIVVRGWWEPLRVERAVAADA